MPGVKYSGTFLNDEIHGVCISTSETTEITAEYRRGKVFGKLTEQSLKHIEKFSPTLTQSYHLKHQLR